eukprot:gene3432-13479_t
MEFAKSPRAEARASYDKPGQAVALRLRDRPFVQGAEGYEAVPVDIGSPALSRVPPRPGQSTTMRARILPGSSRLLAGGGRRSICMPNCLASPAHRLHAPHHRVITAPAGRSVAELQQVADSQGMLDAEALAEALQLQSADELTAAWATRPSRVLGPRRDPNQSYIDGVRAYLGQGGSAAPPLPVEMPAVDGTAHELFREAERRGMVPQAAAVASPLEQRCRVAVDEAMHSLEDVESHLEPQALARVLVSSSATRAAVHVAALADSAWKRVPSRILGPRPAWACESGAGFNYGQLLLLAASEDSEIADGIRNVVNIFGYEACSMMRELQLTDLMDVAFPPSGWGEALKSVPSKPTDSGIPLTTDWEAHRAISEELLNMSLAVSPGGGSVVSFNPPARLPGVVHVGMYSLSTLQAGGLFKNMNSTVLRAWSDIKGGRDLQVSGWGGVQEPKWLQPWVEKGSLPMPSKVWTHGYVAKFFPLVEDSFSVAKLQEMLCPSESAVARYTVKWAERLNGPLAARLDELQEVNLDAEAFNQPPETLLRRVQREREIQKVPFEVFSWLLHPGSGQEYVGKPGDPRLLLEVRSLDDTEESLSVMVLTTSHQMKRAGLVLNNCAASRIRYVKSQEEIVLVLCRRKDIEQAVAMASWKVNFTNIYLNPGIWGEMREANNNNIRQEWKEAFEATEVLLRDISSLLQRRYQEAMELKVLELKAMELKAAREFKALIDGAFIRAPRAAQSRLMGWTEVCKTRKRYVAALAPLLAYVCVRKGENISGDVVATLIYHNYQGYASLSKFLAAVSRCLAAVLRVMDGCIMNGSFSPSKVFNLAVNVAGEVKDLAIDRQPSFWKLRVSGACMARNSGLPVKWQKITMAEAAKVVLDNQKGFLINQRTRMSKAPTEAEAKT